MNGEGGGGVFENQINSGFGLCFQSSFLKRQRVSLYCYSLRHFTYPLPIAMLNTLLGKGSKILLT